MSRAEPNEDDLRLALRAVEEAGETVLRHFRGGGAVEYKSPNQPVTEADLEADRVLHRVLIGERPGYGWLSEETADAPDRLARQRVWIVDPIDGTRSFVDGVEEYVVCVALAVAGEARLGVVLNPSTGELYHAVAGGGAFRNGERLRLAPAAGPRTLLASRSDIRRGEFAPLGGDWTLRPLGSTAYKMVKVADGTATAYVSRGPKSEWDVCAAGLIVTEAGGTVTDVRGTRLRYNRPEPFVDGVVAGDGESHPHLVRRVATFPEVDRGGRQGSR